MGIISAVLRMINSDIDSSNSILVMKSSSQADKRPEIKRLISRVRREQERERATKGTGQEEDAVKRFQLPKKYMHLEEFVKCVQESGIVKDRGTIHRLFDALTVGKEVITTVLCYTCVC